MSSMQGLQRFNMTYLVKVPGQDGVEEKVEGEHEEHDTQREVVADLTKVVSIEALLSTFIVGELISTEGKTGRSQETNESLGLKPVRLS